MQSAKLLVLRCGLFGCVSISEGRQMRALYNRGSVFFFLLRQILLFCDCWGFSTEEISYPIRHVSQFVFEKIL